MKKLLSMITAAVMLICAVCIAPLSAGAEDALTISTAADFKAFADSVNSGDTYEGKTITLANDIDISEICGKNINGEEISWTPIGDFDNPFNGTFDGNGHTVNGLYINSEYMDYAGLFGYCGEGSRISNLIVDGSVTVGFSSSDGEAQAPFEIGGIAALSFGKIANCHNKALITGIGDGAFAGGICDHGALLENCINTGAVVSEGRAGAVAVSTKKLDNCYYLEGTAANGGKAIAKTAEQFASGEVAYLLGTPWGQRIGVDKYPVIGGDRAYLINDKYTNTPPEYPYTINLLKLVSASGEEYDEIPTDTSFIVDMDVTKVADRRGQDYFIVAAYGENGVLVSLNYIKADLPTGAGFSCGVNIQKSDTPIAKIKAFVWDALGTMTPLAETRTISSDAKFLEDRVLAAIYDVPEMTGDAGSFYLNYLNEKLPELDLKYCVQLTHLSGNDDKPFGIYMLTLNTAGKQKVYDAIELLMTLDIVRSAQPDYIARPED